MKRLNIGRAYGVADVRQVNLPEDESIVLFIRRMDNKDYELWRQERSLPMVTKMLEGHAGGSVSFEGVDIHSMLGRDFEGVAHHILVGWDGIVDEDTDTPWEYSVDNAEFLLTEYPTVYDFVVEESAKHVDYRDEYLKELEGNSATSPVGLSSGGSEAKRSGPGSRSRRKIS